jgi:hypothetical protein
MAFCVLSFLKIDTTFRFQAIRLVPLLLLNPMEEDF